MNVAVLTNRLLTDRRRSTMWWVLGILATVVLVMVFYPAVRDQTGLDEALADMPEAVRVISGLEEGESFFSPAGYLNSQFFSNLLPILLLVLAIGLGGSSLAGYEQDGRLEYLMTQPVRRRSVYLSRLVAIAVVPLALALLAGVATVVLAPVVRLEGVPVANVFVASLGAGLLAVLHGVLTLAIGAVTGRKGSAQGIAAMVAVSGFVLYGFGQAAAAWRGVSEWTPWYWYLGGRPLVEGASAMTLLVPLAVALPIAAVGWWRFERRDLR